MDEPLWPPYQEEWLPEIPLPLPLSFVEYVQQLLPAVLLVALSAMFSGLTLGLLSLDTIGLQVIIESGACPGSLAVVACPLLCCFRAAPV